MKDLKLSFVLPCFNVERFIGECLESLFQQDLDCSEYEIICVNDCSTDTTEQIVIEYQKRYSNLKLINHQLNKTAGGARNTGLDNARGQYVWFVDPDDFIEPNVIGQLLDYCTDGNLDILMFNYRAIDRNSNKVNNSPAFENSEVLNGLDYVHKYFKNNLSLISIVWQEIYNLEFLRDNNIKFPEIIIGEDSVFVWRSLLLAKRAQSIEGVCYVYRINEFSIAGSFELAPDAKKIFCSFLFCKEVLVLSKEIELKDQNSSNDLFQNAIWKLNQFLPRLINSKTHEKLKFYSLCKKNKLLLNELLPYMNTNSKMLIHSKKLGFIVWYCVLQVLKLRK